MKCPPPAAARMQVQEHALPRQCQVLRFEHHVDGELSRMIAPVILVHKPRGVRPKSIRTFPQAKAPDKECPKYRRLGVCVFIGTWNADLVLLKLKQNSSRRACPIGEVELSDQPLVSSSLLAFRAGCPSRKCHPIGIRCQAPGDVAGFYGGVVHATSVLEGRRSRTPRFCTVQGGGREERP